MFRKDAIIRVGDSVRVVNPSLFVRCGYPRSVESETERVESEHYTDVASFLKSLGFHDDFGDFRPNNFKRVAKRIIREIAWLRLKQNGFGGSERKIHTREEPSLTGKTGVVTHIKYVKTGLYYSPSYGSWLDGYEWEPGGLSDSKTHKILTIDFGFDLLPIEAVHVTKLDQPTKKVYNYPKLF